MPRPKSEDKRSAIMAAAVEVIASQGLSAPTAAIAKAAGVANGSLFNYFATKADLFNELYRELKLEVVASASDALPDDADRRRQAFFAWSGWMNWGVSCPDKRKTLMQLAVSDEITAESRAFAQQASAGIAQLLERTSAMGPLRGQPIGFVVAIVEAIAGTTMDFMIQHPEAADSHCTAGFEAVWRAIA